ncbi:MAG TPA: rhomboid family intramembrane serine protease [Rhizomicrobium sp.]|nr:rhomboid family intramembrane serine protease [Rhizomicrobium sp.]
MRPQRERIFNVPAVVLAAVVVLFGIHAATQFLSDETNLNLLRQFAFVPGRFTYAFDPQRIGAVVVAAQDKSQFDGAVARFFLGNGTPLWWTPVTYAFLHASYLHVGFNCLWLIAFGAAVARRFGTWRFLLFCLTATVAGALAHYLTHMDDLQPVVGASAVVSGTMGAAVRFVFQQGAPLGEGAGFTDPRFELTYHRPPLPLRNILTDRRAMVFLAAWFFANLLFGLAPQLSGLHGVTIAWQAHIGGFLVGLFAFPLFDPPPPKVAPQDKPLDGELL